MLYSEKWIREWVNPSLSTQEMADKLTMAGLEVDGLEKVRPEFTEVYIGKIEACEKHPDAKKLQVCEVNIGRTENLQIVCGAPNARQGLIVAVAIVGAKLPGDFNIADTTIRGVDSSGMLCSQKELGLGVGNDGIMELPEAATVGQKLEAFLDLDDTLLDIDLTPNRGDCLSIAGAARELSAITGTALTVPKIDPVVSESNDVFNAEVIASEDCPRYLCRIIRGVDLSKPTPTYIAEQLRRMGQKQINAVVDITNYVMFELGQPMHAFDLNKLNGKIVVRKGNNDKIKLLDGKDVTVDSNDLVIADESGAIALAGVMGGLDSSVTDETVDIVLEGAFFTPDIVKGRSRKYGLVTDAAYRYERGVDFNLQATAIERLTQLIASNNGGLVCAINEVVSEPNLPVKQKIKLSPSMCERILGIPFTVEQLEEYLSLIGCDVSVDGDMIYAVAPSNRFDLEFSHDLIEEVARLYGYENIPVNRPMSKTVGFSKKESEIEVRRIRDHFVSRGFDESINYSFVDKKLQDLFHDQSNAIDLQNPIADNLNVMRLSLVTGLLGTAERNLKRQIQSLKLFEIGNTYKKDNDNIVETATVAGLCLGRKIGEFWPNVEKSDNNNDFFSVKGDIESVLALKGKLGEVEFKASQRQGFHPYQCADIYINEELVGFISTVDDLTLEAFGIKSKAVYFQLNLNSLSTRNIPTFTNISKYPNITRDLALLVDIETTSSKILACIMEVASESLINIDIFDSYEGEGIENGKKSLAYAMTFQDANKTLSDVDIDNEISNILNNLKVKLNVSIRI